MALSPPVANPDATTLAANISRQHEKIREHNDAVLKSPESLPPTSNLACGSDYGGFTTDEEEEIDQILSKLSRSAENPLLITDIEDYEAPPGVRIPKMLGMEQRSSLRLHNQASGQTILHRSTTKIASRSTTEARTIEHGAHSLSAEPQPDASSPDTRSPLERFRRPPKKALSVTDIVSPAWCELQYHYTLVKHGRKKRTMAMKQGSSIHKALEDEIHTTVPVDVQTKEDRWGLRVWNVIQGLCTLRDTGRTRELEIWGMVDGEIVNGVIDELSYTCPNQDMENQVEERNNKAQKSKAAPTADQTSITNYLLSSAAGPGQTVSHSGNGHFAAGAEVTQSSLLSRKTPENLIYITDIKTRTAKTLPGMPAMRPTVMQLHLYYQMLTQLALGNVPLSIIVDRYGLDAQAAFSDGFIAQVGRLNQDFFESTSTSHSNGYNALNPRLSSSTPSQDLTDNLLRYNNLSSLWNMMVLHFSEIFLVPTSTSSVVPKTRVSPILTATYLSSTTSELLGNKSVLFSLPDLQGYLDEEMQWWQGKRDARGVELQEAWKCRSCEFQDECSWINERDIAAVEEATRRRKVKEEAHKGIRSGDS